MNLLNAPAWTTGFSFPYSSLADVPDAVFARINQDLDTLLSSKPLVSIVVPSYNEEVNILRCVASLAKLQSEYPLEIIVVNNNSTDRTQETLDKLHIRNAFQPIQGWGPARQKGLEEAHGTYVLTADSDGLYPPTWVDEMMAVLQQPGVVCVYGRYSFLPSPGYSRLQLSVLETMKDVLAEMRHVKRPHLNAGGISIGYLREPALKIGYVMRKIRGEDGRMCFDLMQHGRIKQVRSRKARVWTGTRSFGQDKSFTQALWRRLSNELRRFSILFSAQAPHDTKTSSNDR